jgi:GNAT superfamily N-acetyltransferase
MCRRAARGGPGTAEFAVVVAPAWRRAGLATALILLLSKAAAERGMHTITACYLAENRPIAALAQDAGGWPGRSSNRASPRFRSPSASRHPLLLNASWWLSPAGR